MKQTLTFLVLFLVTLYAHAAVGETFTYEGVQYTISSEDYQTGTYQIYVSHYDTATAIIPDGIIHNGLYYQVTGTPGLLSTTPFGYPQYCSLHHYSKIDYSQVSYPYTMCMFQTLDSLEVDTLILPQNCPMLNISSIGRNDPNAPTGGIHRIFLSDNTQQPLMRVGAVLGMYTQGFGKELREIDLSSYPYTSVPFTFANCSELQKVTLPPTVKVFQSNFFSGNTSLLELTMPDSLELIEDVAFGNLLYDTLSISGRVHTLQPGFATYWYNLRNIYIDPQNPNYMDDEGVLFSKNHSKIERYPVGRPDTTYIIPPYVDTVGAGAFALNSPGWVEFGPDIIYRDESTHYNIAFQHNAPLHEVKMHSGVTTIGYSAFEYSSIRALGASSERDEKAILDFSFANVQYIHNCAFLGSLLDSVSLPATLRYLGSKNLRNQFYWHDDDSFFSARGYAWFDSYLWEKYHHHKDSLDWNECWTEEVLFPGLHFSTTSGSSVFAQCQHLQFVDFSKCRQIVDLGMNTFAHCSQLTSLDLSPCDSIRHIHLGFCMFDSSLTYVHLPYRIDTIDLKAFQNCISLTHIICPAPLPIPIHHSVFDGVNRQNCTLAVPDAFIPLYQAAPIWQDFNIVGNGLTGIAVKSSDRSMGVVHGSAGLHIGDSTVIAATPLKGYEFVGWSDGSTDNPRMIHVLQDSTIIAYFQHIEYYIDARPNDSTLGYVTGGGFYHFHDTVTLWAHPYDNGKFIEWSDGYRYSYRNDIIVTRDTTIIAIFEPYIDTTHTDTTVVRYTLTAIPNDSTMGAVTGSGLYEAGEEAYLTAIPFDGYRFREWDFSFTTELSVIFIMPPRNTTVVATFEPIDDALPATPADPNDPDASTPSYNILGQRVDDTYHGIVIRNGQKVLQ